MEKYWFVRKSYGWGWVPINWKGWAVTFGYIILIVAVFRNIDLASHSVSDTLYGMVIPLIALSAILIAICYAKGEKPRWQWGN